MPRTNYSPYNHKRLLVSMWTLRVFMVVFLVMSPVSFFLFHRMSLQPVERDPLSPAVQKIIDWEIHLIGFASVDSFIQTMQYVLPILLLIAASLFYWMQNKVKTIVG